MSSSYTRRDEENGYNQSNYEREQLISSSNRRQVSDATTSSETERRKKMSSCSRFMDTLRSYYLYHLISFIIHYVSFVVAIVSTITSFTNQRVKIAAAVVLAIFALIAVVVDIYLLYHHYHAQTYFPYCAASNLLFMTKNIRVDPSPPPNATLYLYQKMLIFWQGYLFVVIPYSNIVLMLNKKKGVEMTDFEQMIFVFVIIQLVITLVGWVLFLIFYLVFIFEALIRFFCFFCCMYRPRHNTQPVESDDHILASHESDPIFYKPYAWLYEYM